MPPQGDAQIDEVKEKKPSHYLAGIGVSGMFWWWGAVLLFTPIYLNISGTLTFFIITGLGAISIVISFVGALLEIARLWKSEALSYFAAAALFLVPGIIVYISIYYRIFPSNYEFYGKIAVILFLLVGGPLFIAGIPYLFPDINKEQTENIGETMVKKPKERVNLATKISFITAFLALITAIIRIVIDFRL